MPKSIDELHDSSGFEKPHDHPWSQLYMDHQTVTRCQNHSAGHFALHSQTRAVSVSLSAHRGLYRLAEDSQHAPSPSTVSALLPGNCFRVPSVAIADTSYPSDSDLDWRSISRGRVCMCATPPRPVLLVHRFM